MPIPAVPRRRALTLLAGGTLPLILPGVARAGRRWCRIDPLFQIDGQIAHLRLAILVESRREARALATGAIQVVVQVPREIESRYIASDAALGFDYEVSVEPADDLLATDELVPVVGSVLVPMAEDAPVAIEFAPSGQGRLRLGGGAGQANALVPFAAPGQAPPAFAPRPVPPPRRGGRQGRKRRDRAGATR